MAGPCISLGGRFQLISWRSIPWLPRPGAGAYLSYFTGFLITELLEQQEDCTLGGAARQIGALQHWLGFPKVQLGLALGHTQEMKRVRGGGDPTLLSLERGFYELEVGLQNCFWLTHRERLSDAPSLTLRSAMKDRTPGPEDQGVTQKHGRGELSWEHPVQQHPTTPLVDQRQ